MSQIFALDHEVSASTTKCCIFSTGPFRKACPWQTFRKSEGNKRLSRHWNFWNRTTQWKKVISGNPDMPILYIDRFFFWNIGGSNLFEFRLPKLRPEKHIDFLKDVLDRGDWPFLIRPIVFGHWSSSFLFGLHFPMLWSYGLWTKHGQKCSSCKTQNANKTYPYHARKKSKKQEIPSLSSGFLFAGASSSSR